MVRLVSDALIIFSLPAVAWGNPPMAAEDERQARSFQMPRPSADRRYIPEGPFGRAEIAPNTHFGFGMFGLKSEKAFLQSVTGGEIDTPKRRRAAVGFSLKF
jgi:hypothetical protein